MSSPRDTPSTGRFEFRSVCLAKLDTPYAFNAGELHANSQTQLPAELTDTSPVVTRLDDCHSSPIQWLWNGRVPAGKLTLLVGDPGLGKSFVTLDIAARVSRGRPLPHLSDEHRRPSTTPGSVVLLSAEDDVSDTIRPRLVATRPISRGLRRLEAVRSPDPERGQPRDMTFSLANDLGVLEQLISSLDRCRLVVIDPITAYLGAGDSHNNAEMRSLLAPLSDLASRTGVAVLAINHLNKAGQGPAIYRSMGSLAFAATARSVLAVLRDPHDQGACVLCRSRATWACQSTEFATGSPACRRWTKRAPASCRPRCSGTPIRCE